jgi:hypothetical protein
MEKMFLPFLCLNDFWVFLTFATKIFGSFCLFATRSRLGSVFQEDKCKLESEEGQASKSQGRHTKSFKINKVQLHHALLACNNGSPTTLRFIVSVMPTTLCNEKKLFLKHKKFRGIDNKLFHGNSRVNYQIMFIAQMLGLPQKQTALC